MAKACYKHGLFAIPYTNFMACDYCKLKLKPKTLMLNIVGITRVWFRKMVLTFDPAKLYIFQRLVKGTTKLSSKECNK
jgi:hypothetical protein